MRVLHLYVSYCCNESILCYFPGPQNILELSVYDEDLIMKDDICFKVSYDVSEILPGQLIQKTFRLNPQVGEKAPG